MKKSAKTNIKATSTTQVKRARRRKLPHYRSFRLHPRITSPHAPLPSSVQLMRIGIIGLRSHWRLFLTISVWYLVLTLLFVRGFGSGIDTAGLKTNFQTLFKNQGTVASTLAVFGTLMSNVSTANNSLANTYQSILLVIMSLAFIWALRHSQAATAKKTAALHARDAFYKGMAPLIPFLLVLLVIGLQLLPVGFASGMYSALIVNGLAVTAIEKAVWGILIILLALLSFYMITSSLFALYIVTLPNMTPFKALRSARQLVQFRRWTVMRKILLLAIFLLIVSAALVIPAILLAPALAQWILFVYAILAVPVLHSYIYNLYRALL